jgi:peroxiredoxin
MTKRKSIMSILVMLIAVAAIVATGCGDSEETSDDGTETAPTSSSGSMQVPDFNLDRLGGGKLSRDDILGAPAVINFEASWCGPCELEAPAIARAHAQYGDKVQFFGIAVQDPSEQQQQFVDEYGWTFPVGLDFGGDIVTEFQKAARVPRGVIPTTFFVDSEGNIVEVFLGPIPEDALVELIEALIASDPGGAAPAETATALTETIGS